MPQYGCLLIFLQIYLATVLGAIGYAFVIATLEATIVVGIMAADYIKKSRDRTRKELMVALLAKAQTTEEQAIIRRLATEQGIELASTTT